jgi:hypothetical protein
MNDSLTSNLDRAIEAWEAHQALKDIDYNLSKMWLEQCLIYLDKYFDSALNNPMRNLKTTEPTTDVITELMNYYDQAAHQNDEQMMNYYLDSLDSEIDKLREGLCPR